MTNLLNQQIRSFAPIGNEIITFGLAAQTVEWDVVLPKVTNLISFGISGLVCAGTPNDPILPAWIVSIRMTINGTHNVIWDFSRAEYIEFVQNLESQEADIISNGNMLIKYFDPPLPAETRIGLAIVVNTLALSFAAATGAVGRMAFNSYDSQEGVYAKKLTFYQRIPRFPNAAIAAAEPYDVDLGTEEKIIKWLFINEWTAAALSDTFTSMVELLVDGNVIARVNETTMKKHYSQISDGLVIPVGRKMLKLPGEGWQASQTSTLRIRAYAHTAAATGSWTGIQVLEKPYT